MARLQKQELLSKISDGIEEGGWHSIIVRRSHPFELKVYNPEEGFLVRIYIWNLTHGGGPVRPVDEYRIQITGIPNEVGFLAVDVEKVLILGWWDEAGVFAGFDYQRHRGSLGSSPSIQIREEALRKAVINGFATHNKGSGEIALAFRPEFLPEYVRNLEGLHSFGGTEANRLLLEAAIENPDAVNDMPLEDLNEKRKTVLVKVARAVRDRSFSDRVLCAYGHRCGFCDLQLKLVEAAHILPVGHTAMDETTNGIALCVLHHRAFDRGLVTLNGLYQVLLSDTKMSELRRLGFDGGAAFFRRQLRAVIHVPPARSDRPNIGLIRKANRLRGWPPDSL
ncbi:hypothetical protein BH18GEM1_BH18GEM1_15100 [soil metagenome]